MSHRKPEAAGRQGWLVCNTVGPGLSQGTGGYPSVIRECRMDDCGAQVWVSTLHLEHTESGQLWPRCWDCQARLGTPVALHEADRAYLSKHGQLEPGWRAISEMNEWLESGAGAPDQSHHQQNGADHGHDHPDHISNGAQRVREQAS